MNLPLPRQEGEGLLSSRRSRSFYPAQDPELAARIATGSFDGYYTYLLYQDLSFVVPYRLGEADAPNARVVGPDADRVAVLIERAIAEREYTRSLVDGVRHFVSTTAQYMVIGGPVTYEIDYRRPIGSAADLPTSFKLELVVPGTLAEYRGATIQYVPAAFGGAQDAAGHHYVELDSATLVTFRLDPDLEAPVQKMVNFLRAANDQQGAEATLMEESLSGSSPYNFGEHQLLRSELFAKATQPVGWNVRGLFKEGHLEPYDVWRQIRFLEFKIRLRESILARLNATIMEVGQRLGFSASIELTGVPSLSDVERAKEDVRSGRRGLGELATFAV